MPVSRGAVALVALALLMQPSMVRAEVTRAAREGDFRTWISAKVLAIRGDTLVVLNPESSRPETLAVRMLGIVETEQGRHLRAINVIRGLVAGVVVGTVAAGLSYKLRYEDCHGGELCGFGIPLYLAKGAAIGGGIGLGLGSIPARSWERIHVSPGARRWLDSLRAWP